MANSPAVDPAPGWAERWLQLDLAPHPELTLLARELHAWAMDFARNRRDAPLLVLCGPSGNGKTHCARGLTRYAQAVAISSWERGWWRSPPQCHFAAWSALLESDPQGQWRDALAASLLVVDDAGSETDRYRSGQPTERLRELLGQRERRWTVLTTNVLPEQWRARWDARVEDRLLRHSRILNLEGIPSYARWLRQAHDVLNHG